MLVACMVAIYVMPVSKVSCVLQRTLYATASICAYACTAY